MAPAMGLGAAGVDPSMGSMTGRGQRMHLPDLAMLLSGSSFRWSTDGAERLRFTTWGRGSATAGMVAATGAASRVRVALEGAGRFAFGAHELTPLIELGARHDAGDAEAGYGMELGLGLGYANAELGLSFETRGRVLLAHEDGGLMNGARRVRCATSRAARAADCGWD